MKRRFFPFAPLASVIALTCAGVAVAPSALAQEDAPAPAPALCDPAADPLDAVNAAPEMHQVVREDHQVRVLREILAPGETSGVHIHALPSIIEGETGGDQGARFVYIEYAEIDGALVEVARNVVSPRAGRRVAPSGPEGPHAIANVGDVALELIRTEFKPEDCTPRVG